MSTAASCGSWWSPATACVASQHRSWASSSAISISTRAAAAGGRRTRALPRGPGAAGPPAAPRPRPRAAAAWRGGRRSASAPRAARDRSSARRRRGAAVEEAALRLVRREVAVPAAPPRRRGGERGVADAREVGAMLGRVAPGAWAKRAASASTPAAAARRARSDVWRMATMAWRWDTRRARTCESAAAAKGPNGGRPPPSETLTVVAVAVEGGQRVGDAAEGVRDAGDDVARRRARVGRRLRLERGASLRASRSGGRRPGGRRRGRTTHRRGSRLVVADEREVGKFRSLQLRALGVSWRSLHGHGGKCRPRRRSPPTARRVRGPSSPPMRGRPCPSRRRRASVVEQRRVEVRPRSEHVAAAAVVAASSGRVARRACREGDGDSGWSCSSVRRRREDAALVGQQQPIELGADGADVEAAAWPCSNARTHRGSQPTIRRRRRLGEVAGVDGGGGDSRTRPTATGRWRAARAAACGTFCAPPPPPARRRRARVGRRRSAAAADDRRRRDGARARPAPPRRQGPADRSSTAKAAAAEPHLRRRAAGVAIAVRVARRQDPPPPPSSRSGLTTSTDTPGCCAARRREVHAWSSEKCSSTSRAPPRSGAPSRQRSPPGARCRERLAAAAARSACDAFLVGGVARRQRASWTSSDPPSSRCLRHLRSFRLRSKSLERVMLQRPRSRGDRDVHIERRPRGARERGSTRRRRARGGGGAASRPVLGHRAIDATRSITASPANLPRMVAAAAA